MQSHSATKENKFYLEKTTTLKYELLWLITVLKKKMTSDNKSALNQGGGGVLGIKGARLSKQVVRI